MQFTETIFIQVLKTLYPDVRWEMILQIFCFLICKILNNAQKVAVTAEWWQPYFHSRGPRFEYLQTDRLLWPRVFLSVYTKRRNIILNRALPVAST
jgi:hypothetical protein